MKNIIKHILIAALSSSPAWSAREANDKSPAKPAHAEGKLSSPEGALMLKLDEKGNDPKPDAELLRLEAALDAAMRQGEMNIASQKISDYWDRKLTEVEKKITRKLTADEQVQFAALKEQWSAYRKQQMDFHAALFDGGTIKPLMASGAYSRITQHRVRELEGMFADALRGRVDN